jgi:hypothetical protein
LIGPVCSSSWLLSLMVSSIIKLGRLNQPAIIAGDPFQTFYNARFSSLRL